MSRLALLIVLILSFNLAKAQDEKTQILSYQDYLKYIQAFHPVARQAMLIKENARQQLKLARGNFDPELFHQSERKEFTEKNYFTYSTSGIKLPLWYGIEFKAQYDLANGAYINPENTVPNQGLSTVGIKVPVLQGLVINQRMADLQQAKILQDLAEAEMQKEVNKFYQKATLAYWDWSAAALKKSFYAQSYDLAVLQLQNTRDLFLQGAKSAFDTLETYTQMQNRWNSLLEFTQKENEKRAKASNFLWTANQEPVAIPQSVSPENILDYSYQSSGIDSALTIINNIEVNNPELRSLQFKIEQVKVKQRLQASYLLPKLDVQYNILNSGFALGNETFQPDYFTNNYKYGINFSYPLFIREERAKLKLATIDLENTQLTQQQRTLEIKNELSALIENYLLINQQLGLGLSLVNNFGQLFEGERTRFFNGESDFFVVNSRELNYLSQQIKLIDLNVKQIEIGTNIDINLGRVPTGN